MKSVFNFVWPFVFMFMGLFGLVWAIQGNSFFMYKYFAPKYEQTRRQVFEESKAYNQGVIQELQNMQFDYIRADNQHKEALASIILHRAADYDINRMPYDLRVFVEDLRVKESGRNIERRHFK